MFSLLPFHWKSKTCAFKKIQDISTYFARALLGSPGAVGVEPPPLDGDIDN